METNNNGKMIADSTLEALGGLNRLVVMTGAKNFMFDANGTLTFRIGKGAKDNINCVRVSLVNDLYTVEFLYIRGLKVKTVSKVEGVYGDMMMDTFEEATGFFLTLHRRVA